VLFAGATALRDASGIVGDVSNSTQYNCFPNRSCEWGLMNSYSVSNWTGNVRTYNVALKSGHQTIVAGETQ
jgi:hypothetical protein